MIPYVSQNTQSLNLASAAPSKTYLVDFENGKIKGMTDGAQAVKQAVYLILTTQRYTYPIYSRSYGVELNDLIGKPTDYCMAEIKTRITEALCMDDRIVSVEHFAFEEHRNALTVSFTVKTIYGDISAETEVQL